MTLELADGRGELFQWDTGRIVEFGEDAISQAHFTNTEKVIDIPYTVEVKNRKAAIPDELLQVPGKLIVYAWVSDTNGGYTKVQVNFPVFARPKPSDYVYTPTEHAGFDRLRAEIGDLSALQTDAKDTLVAAINEAAASGGADWAQNDPTAKDYVKNRPGGYDVVTPEKIISEWEMLGSNYVSIKLSEPLVGGRSYRLTFSENADYSNPVFDSEVVASIEDSNDSTQKGSIYVTVKGYASVVQPVTYPEDSVIYSCNNDCRTGYCKLVALANTETIKIPDKYTNAITYTTQTLTDVQKKQARENVDAASDFVIKTTNSPGAAITLDKTFAEITEAVAGGKRAVLHLIEGDAAYSALCVTDINSQRINFESTSNDTPLGVATIRVTVSSHDDVTFVLSIVPIFNDDGTLSQQFMSADPTEDMQIATKKYVDDSKRVQSDWDEQNEEAPGYIRNKPDFGPVVLYEGSPEDGTQTLFGTLASEMTAEEADALVRKYKPFLVDNLGGSILDAFVTGSSIIIYQVGVIDNKSGIISTTIPIKFKPAQTNTNTSTST